MSGLPAVPAFRHDAPQHLDASTTSSTSSVTATGGAMSVDGPAAVGVELTIDAAVVDTVDPAALGPWGCNAAPDCANPAVIQWAAPAPTDDDPLRTVPVFACDTHKGA